MSILRRQMFCAGKIITYILRLQMSKMLVSCCLDLDFVTLLCYNNDMMREKLCK